MIAQLRGAKFKESENGKYLQPLPDDVKVCFDAIDDIAEWLGYSDGPAYITAASHGLGKVWARIREAQ